MRFNLTIRRCLVSWLLLGTIGGCEINGQDIDSGIEGVVSVGPIGPERKGHPLLDAPYAATIIVQDDRRQQITTARSGEDGTFRVRLPPDVYWLEPVSPQPGVPPLAFPTQVTVRAHQFTHVEIRYDTGLR